MSTDLARSEDGAAPDTAASSSAGEGSSHRLRGWAVALSVVVVVGVVAVLTQTLGPTLGKGPLSPPPNATFSGVSVKVGDTVSWGGSYLLNDSREPVTLRAVQVKHADKAGSWPRIDRLEALDPTTATTGIGTAEGDGYSIIAKDLRRPVEGFELAPGRYVNVLVKLTAAEQGVWSFDSVEVTYEAGGRTYDVELPQKFVMCVDTPTPCEAG